MNPQSHKDAILQKSRGCGDSRQAQKKPAFRFSGKRVFVSEYTVALLAGNGKQHLDIQMPSLLGFWTEAFCASVYPYALLAGIVKLQSTADGPSLQTKTICPRFERYRFLRQFRYCFFDFFLV